MHKTEILRHIQKLDPDTKARLNWDKERLLRTFDETQAASILIREIREIDPDNDAQISHGTERLEARKSSVIRKHRKARILEAAEKGAGAQPRQFTSPNPDEDEMERQVWALANTLPRIMSASASLRGFKARATWLEDLFDLHRAGESNLADDELLDLCEDFITAVSLCSTVGETTRGNDS